MGVLKALVLFLRIWFATPVHLTIEILALLHSKNSIRASRKERRLTNDGFGEQSGTVTRRNNRSFDATLRLIAKSRWRSERDILRHQAARAVTRWISVSMLVRFRSSRLGGPRSQNLAGSNLSHRRPGSLDMTGRSSLDPLPWRTLHGVPRSQPPNTTVGASPRDSSPAPSDMADRM